jgi:hypothetical protein
VLAAGKSSRLAVALLAAALLALAVSACGVSIAEDGHHVVRSRAVAPFQRIEVHGSTEVTVERGAGRALRVEGGVNRVHDLRTRVEGATLVVEEADSSGTIDLGGDPARVLVRTPRLEAVRIDGSGAIEARGLRGPSLDVSINGSGDVRADGRIGRLRSLIDGSGSLHLAALRTDRAAVTVSGSGAADLGASRRLDAQVAGSGDVSYAGDPEVSEEVDGSGQVERRFGN